MSEGEGERGDRMYPGPNGSLVICEGGDGVYPGPNGSLVMSEGGDEVYPGPSGLRAGQLLPCYPCVMSPGGTTATVSSDATVYQVTESGRIHSWQPANTPELVSSDDDGDEPLTSGRRRRRLDELLDVLHDSGSDDDEAVADEETFRLQGSMKEMEREIEQERENEREQEREKRIDSGKERGRGARTARSYVAPVDTNFNWSADFRTFTGQKEQFTLEPGPAFSSQDPVELFSEIWDFKFVQMVVKETNIYAWQVISQLSDPDMGTEIPSYLDSWTDVTVEELYRYFAILIYLSHCQRDQIQEYWTTGTLEMAKFRKIMPRGRFQLIHKFLHFVSNEELLTTGHNRKIEKVAPVVNHCNLKFAGMYTPSQYLCLDQSLLLWKGRLNWKQCMRSKAARFGIKSYELCEATTGYLLQYRLHTARSVEMHPNTLHGFQDRTAKIVLDLMEGYLDVGHVLVMDSWYNQLPIARYLKTRRTDVLGTINRRRFGIPSEIKALNVKYMDRGTMVSRHSGDIALVAWKNFNLVTVMSTYHQNLMVPGIRAGRAISKPAAAAEYNKYMGGVGLKDRKLTMYLLERKKNQKWYMKVFRRLLNTSLLNSFILYSKNPMRRVYSQRQFRLSVSEGLLKRYSKPFVSSVPKLVPLPTPRPARPAHLSALLRLQPGNHFPIHTEVSSGAEKGKRKQLRCVRCVALQRRSCVTLKCELCNVALCAGTCWKEYHTLQYLK